MRGRWQSRVSVPGLARAGARRLGYNRGALLRRWASRFGTFVETASYLLAKAGRNYRSNARASTNAAMTNAHVARPMDLGTGSV